MSLHVSSTLEFFLCTGDFETAAQVLDNVELIVPGLAMVQCRRIGLRRRQGHFKEAQDLYQKCVDEAEDVSVGSFYSIKYARYLSKVCVTITFLCSLSLFDKLNAGSAKPSSMVIDIYCYYGVSLQIVTLCRHHQNSYCAVMFCLCNYIYQ